MRQNDAQNSQQYAPVTLSFMSTTFGRCSDGEDGRFDVHEMASTKPNSQGQLVYSVEHVKVHCGH